MSNARVVMGAGKRSTGLLHDPDEVSQHSFQCGMVHDFRGQAAGNLTDGSSIECGV